MLFEIDNSRDNLIILASIMAGIAILIHFFASLFGSYASYNYTAWELTVKRLDFYGDQRTTNEIIYHVYGGANESYKENVEALYPKAQKALEEWETLFDSYKRFTFIETILRAIEVVFIFLSIWFNALALFKEK